MLSYLLTAFAAYLLGSIPTGYLVAKAKGIDIRSVGSGNIGATNVFRILGRQAGVFVLLVDALKGFLACWLIVNLVRQHIWANPGFAGREVLEIIAGVSAILGHNYTCFLRFKGGKGIATTAGVLIALVPWALLTVLAIWILVFAISRYVSFASITAAFCLPFVVWLLRSSQLMIFITAILALLAIYKHTANIKRLLNGTENRIGKKKKAEVAK
ncbi:MAG: glycerol-3-phosphate 1-O-acyltransferase PlsY [Verrucomicrobiota bacterium]